MSQTSSSSPGAQRTYRSPLRHTPYKSENHRHRSHDENWNYTRTGIGPGRSGDFDNQYPPYDSSVNGPFERTPGPLSTSQNFDHPRRLRALTILVNIDELSEADAMTMLYLRILRMEQQNDEIQGQIQGLQTHLVNIAGYCTQTWKPSKQQVKSLKALLRHYIIRPITSYPNVAYIHDHAKRLHLELYKQDPTVKAAVNELLVAENSALRSALRKLVFASVEKKTPLSTFSKEVIDAYHLPTIPTVAPQDIKAYLAMMRAVARPLTGKKNSRGGDTGFWATMEDQLDQLFEKNGNDRNNNKYSHRAAESNARTQEEIDAAVLTAPLSNTSLAANDGEVNDEEGVTDSDREVNVAGLGDIASLSAGPVSR
ncbi:hypothetical protein B0H13DRAFT_2359384 [Mycena leptocephala]|nr:hypothetical protein B0H13DRAFT_2363820 [Mycena leptocephala]KAJ7852716.1 hypothetical protein B0H13DRAFT_2359384 [Mycena leptocephala]